jgi:hypothetical protein
VSEPSTRQLHGSVHPLLIAKPSGSSSRLLDHIQQFQNELERERPEDDSEPYLDVPRLNLHGKPRTMFAPMTTATAVTAMSAMVQTAERRVSDDPEERGEDHDEADRAGGIFDWIPGR